MDSAVSLCVIGAKMLTLHPMPQDGGAQDTGSAGDTSDKEDSSLSMVDQ